MHNPGRIYLIGMMGVGKSTIARLVAQRLEWIWIDTDACVERNSCLTIAEVFSLFGEEEFRRREWGCVQQTIKFRNIVVACGGGTPCFYNAMDLMLDSGIVIYLKSGIDALVERLMTETRPLLTGTDISLKERLHILLEEREPVYLRASYTLDTDHQTEEQVAERVLELISKY
jgi:shikimate kinase